MKRSTSGELAPGDDLPYGLDVVDDGGVWPQAGFALLEELRTARGTPALVDGASPNDADGLVDRFRVDLGLNTVWLGSQFADADHPPSLADVEAVCGEATVLTDLDVLFWPVMHAAPLQLLAVLARRHPIIAVWPGHISSVRATYAAPGRPDHHDAPLPDVIVLRPHDTRFPDEVPFTIERILR